MLVIVHHRDVEALLQTLLNVETLWRLDILKVDTAEGGGDALHSLAELLRVVLVDLNIEDVNAAIDFEEQSLTLHDRLA